MMGLIKAFSSLFIFRFLLGIFESVFNPCIYSLLCDIFHPSYRARANAVFNTGIYFGGALSSLSLNLIKLIGWRMTHEVIGVIGIVVGVLCCLILKEPVRNKFD